MTQANFRRRDLLAGAGAAMAAGAIATGAQAQSRNPKWDHEVDLVCVGSGAAAGTAAVIAAGRGASVMVLEKMPILGGTTGKSGGVCWIPNNSKLRARGLSDPRDDCLRYMARYAYPHLYDPAGATLGLSDLQYRLIAATYDNGSLAVDELIKLQAVDFKEFRLFQVDRPAPDYADHLPENKLPAGRCLEPAVGSGSAEGGGTLAARLEEWLRARKVPILTDTRVTGVVQDGGRVIGVEAETEGRKLRIRARKGVIFGSGGYAHNVDLIRQHQVALYGSCATPGATGDFISIAQEAGAMMGPLNNAWRTQVVLEEALESRTMGACAFVLPGDSMILVNKFGKRVVNEKRDYNDRTRVHFAYDPTHEDYPNQLLFMLFDERSIDAFGDAYPFPADRRDARYLVQGTTVEELTRNLAERVEKISGATGGARLAPDFAGQAKASIERFNGYAKAGHDPEFDRGLHAYDREWHLLFSARRDGTRYPANPMPNVTMHPFTDKGPYYAYILAAGALDTNSGPVINEKAQVLGARGAPIAGLYGAGNCISSPSNTAYYGAGGTIGLAMTFGYIAAVNALKEPAA